MRLLDCYLGRIIVAKSLAIAHAGFVYPYLIQLPM